MGKCLFNMEWLSKKEYAEWLRACDNDRKAKCSWCSKEFDIANMGEAAVKSHMKGE